MATLTADDKRAIAQAEKLAVKTEKVFIDVTSRLLRDLDFSKELDADTLARINEFALLLDESVYDEIFEDFIELYGDRAEEIQSRISKAGRGDLVYSGADLDTMEAIINTDFEKVTNAIAKMGTTVRQEVIRGVLLGSSGQIDTEQITGGLSGAITEDAGKLKRNVETEIRTGEMAFNRTVSNTQALKLGFTEFQYVGPADGKMRDFCAEHIGRVYTFEQINGLDNGQGLDVFEFGGGYNCRHVWSPVK